MQYEVCFVELKCEFLIKSCAYLAGHAWWDNYMNSLSWEVWKCWIKSFVLDLCWWSSFLTKFFTIKYFLYLQILVLPQSTPTTSRGNHNKSKAGFVLSSFFAAIFLTNSKTQLLKMAPVCQGKNHSVGGISREKQMCQRLSLY